MGFFNVIGRAQTYINIFYLLLSFPLSIFYFVFLITGIATGLGLSITLIGIPLLVLVMFLWRVLGYFELRLAQALLLTKLKIPKTKPAKRLVKRITNALSDLYTWKALGYLVLKFPLGIISFVSIVVLLTVSICFISVPFLYYLYNTGAITFEFSMPFEYMMTYWFTISVGVLGVLLFFLSLHIFNLLALLHAKFAELLAE